MNYIEKEKDGEYRNPVSCTVEVNPDNKNCNCTSDDQTENSERWKWLTDNWENMTFKERMALFIPYLHYVNPRNNYKIEFDEVFNKEMLEMSYKLCRNFREIKFDPDHQGIPNIVMIFDPINYKQIPDTATKISVRLFGERFGFIEKDLSSNMTVLD